MEELAPDTIRRNVHLPCSLELGGRTCFGHTVSVGSRKLYVRFLQGQLPEPLPEPGAPLTLSLQLEDQAQRFEGSVLWVDPADRTLEGRSAVGLGLERTGAGGDPAGLLSFLRGYRHRVLLASLSGEERASIIETLGTRYQLEAVETGRDALAALSRDEVALVLVSSASADLPLPELVEGVQGLGPHARVLVLVDGKAPRDRADELIEQGSAVQYLARPFRPSELEQRVHRAVESHAIARENAWLQTELEHAHQRLRRENVYLQERNEAVQGFDGIIGQSPALRRALGELAQVRQSDAPVYLHGETGTGKELVARALHYGGARAAFPFVSQNCAGIPETLLESTLFGHLRGTFTGAVRDHEGLFQQAHRGTLFLDEVAELSPKVQASLLRVLQHGELVPVGASAPSKVDVRIVCATHDDLAEAVRAGRFREDLYFRLVVVTLRLPPLRERREDIPLLARHFLGLYARRYGKDVPGFTAEALDLFMLHGWPGNVRELENVIERALVLADDGPAIGTSLLPSELHTRAPRVPSAEASGELLVPPGLSFDMACEWLERAMVARALDQCAGNLSKAATQLGVERSRLGKIRRRLGLAREGAE
jgi:two-component system response regulator AtoC